MILKNMIMFWNKKLIGTLRKNDDDAIIKLKI